MIQTIKVWHKEHFPKPQWIKIAHESDKGQYYCIDEDIYHYVDCDNVFEQWDLVMLDEEMLIVEVQE